MKPDHRLWIILADGENARVLLAANLSNHYATVHQFSAKDAHFHHRDSGAPGAKTVHRARQAFEHHLDPHQTDRRDFLHRFADWIDEQAGNDSFDRLAIIAPARALGELRARLGPATRARLTGVLAKDLLKVPDHDIQSHLTWDLIHGGDG